MLWPLLFFLPTPGDLAARVQRSGGAAAAWVA